MKSFFRDKKILITGHTGFQGAWLSEIMLRWGANVAGVALHPHTTPNLFDILDLSHRMRNYWVDVRDFPGMRDVFVQEKPDIVFHLAAQALVRESYDNPLDTFSTNIIGTANLLEVMRKVPGTRAAVIVTTDKVYRNTESLTPYKETDSLGGHDPYSASKAAADIVTQSYLLSFFNHEHAVQSQTVSIGIARSGNVIGGGDWGKDRLIPDIIRSLWESTNEEAMEIIIRNPNSVRPWQYVLEPLHGYLLLATRLFQGDGTAVGAWNFGPETTNTTVTVEQIVQESITFFGRGTYKVVAETHKPETKKLTIAISKATDVLKWRPRFLFRESLQRTLQWYRMYYENASRIRALTEEEIDTFFSFTYE